MGFVLCARKKKMQKIKGNKSKRSYLIVNSAVREQEQCSNSSVKVAVNNQQKINAKCVEKIVLTTCKFVTFAVLLVLNINKILIWRMKNQNLQTLLLKAGIG
jgi:hypothetical protein